MLDFIGSSLQCLGSLIMLFVLGYILIAFPLPSIAVMAFLLLATR